MRLYFSFIALIGYSQASAQNLLVNGSFEEENYCIEYNVACAPEGWIYTVPSFIYYFKDERLAHSGSKFVGLIAGNSKKPFYRTFVRSRLLCGLRKGTPYKLQFYIKSRHPILDSVGVYFSSYDFLFEKKAYSQLVPLQFIADAQEKPVSRDTAWQKVVMNFIATGEESFLTFGFFNRIGLDRETGIDRENNFFFLLDDVSLLPINPAEKLCPDWMKRRDEIHAQDERHEYLSRLIQYKRKGDVERVKNTITTVQKIDTIVIPDVLFATGSAILNNRSFSILDSLFNGLQHLFIDSLVIEGHTDSTGNILYNEKLSANRSVSVADYIKQKYGPPHFPIITRKWAGYKPVAPNRTSSGRQKNRRVELYLYIGE